MLPKATLAIALGLAMAIPVLAASAAGEARGKSPAPALLTVERDVRPIFKTHCFHCHGENGHLKSGLDLRLQRLTHKGGKHGPAIVPGKADDSLLVQKLRDGKMPPEEKPG